MTLISIYDLTNPETGKTYRAENAEMEHKIPLGALVEIVSSGARAFIAAHTRDCDQTPLYSLSLDPLDEVGDFERIYKLHHGYSDDSLVLVPAAPVPGADAKERE